MITVENKQLRKLNEESGKMVKYEINVHDRSCTFDRLGSRFLIHVAKIDDKEYLVSIPNFFFSMTTPRPYDIAYKLTERGVMTATDAESVEMAIAHLMAI
jgi:hypothetical protein